MHKFKDKMTEYLSEIDDINDRRLVNIALHIIEAEPILNNQTLNVLNEIFTYISDNYNIKITKDFDTLEFMIVLVQKQKSLIENDHEIGDLINELINKPYDEKISDVEKLSLIFLNNCKHTDEDDIILIEQILKYLDNNWDLSPLSITEYQEQKVKGSHLVPKKILTKK